MITLNCYMQCQGTGKLSLLATNNLSDCIQLLMFNLVIFLSAARCLFFYRRQVSNPFLPSLLKLNFSDDDFFQFQLTYGQLSPAQ